MPTIAYCYVVLLSFSHQNRAYLLLSKLSLSNLCRCIEPMLIIAAAMAYGRPPWLSPMDKRAEAMEAKRTLAESAFTQRSDHIALIAGFKAWATAKGREGRRAASELARRAFLSEQVNTGWGGWVGYWVGWVGGYPCSALADAWQGGFSMPMLNVRT
jgi:hypothetical protein